MPLEHTNMLRESVLVRGSDDPTAMSINKKVNLWKMKTNMDDGRNNYIVYVIENEIIKKT